MRLALLLTGLVLLTPVQATADPWFRGFKPTLADNDMSILVSNRNRRSAPSAAQRAAPDHTDARHDEYHTHFQRQIKATQKRLEREEKSLQQRLSKLNRMRENALNRQDEKQLKRIETLEKNAISTYESRVNHLVASAEQGAGPNSRSHKKTARQINSRTKSQPSTYNHKRYKPTQSKRRFLVWPFGD